MLVLALPGSSESDMTESDMNAKDKHTMVNAEPGKPLMATQGEARNGERRTWKTFDGH